MARLYLTLYGVLFLAYALFVAGVIWLPDRVLHGTVQRYYERALMGAYYLVEDRLAAHSPEQWEAVIRELVPHFRYGLGLYHLDELAFLDAERVALRDGRLLFRDDGEQTQFYKRVLESDRYLKMVLGPNPEQEEVDQVAGIVYLVESRFRSRDEKHWPDVLAELGRVFEMPLALLALDDQALPAARIADIRKGETVVLGLKNQQETYFKRLGDSSWVFRAGPLETPLILRHFNFVLMVLLAMVIALAAFVWIRPVWRDLKHFDHGVRCFGTGDLEARLAARKGSALAPLADTFNAMADRMQRLIRSHRELTNAVSHELRTPIARLRFRVDMLEEPVPEADLHRHIGAMRKDIVELEELVSESLRYARLDRERPELAPESVALMDWLATLLDDMQPEMSGVAVRLIGPPDGTAPQVRLDSRLMARAVKNLLRNAHRHAHQRILVAGECQGAQARVIVEDDGGGVPVGERDRIFAPFARLDAARDRGSGGVGLGLAIVRQIVRWHDGKVWVEESGLGGARFVVEWPATLG